MDYLKELLSKQYSDITNIINGYIPKKVTLRINILKTDVDYVKKVLDLNNIKYSLVSWYSNALIIENVKEDVIRELDIYNDGFIYLQSLSSMIPALVLDPSNNDRILDMTAAPGGKTTQISTLSDCYITACEKNKIRCDRLKYNINKQGSKKVTVLNNDALELDDLFSFDKILLDAPCSGSGTITNNFFNYTLIDKCSNIQYQLLEKAIKLLKKGSIMVYSTCSILSKENEEQLEKLFKRYNLEIVPIMINDIPLLDTKIKGTICVCPNELYEGFFVAKIKKM